MQESFNDAPAAYLLDFNNALGDAHIDAAVASVPNLFYQQYAMEGQQALAATGAAGTAALELQLILYCFLPLLVFFTTALAQVRLYNRSASNKSSVFLPFFQQLRSTSGYSGFSSLITLVGEEHQQGRECLP